jgi:hypothetical protein
MEFTPRRNDAKKCDECVDWGALGQPPPFGSRFFLGESLFLGRPCLASLRLRVRSI